MGRRKKNLRNEVAHETIEHFESTSEACANCAHGEPNEMGSIRCPYQDEPMGKANRCGEFRMRGQESETREEQAKTCGTCGLLYFRNPDSLAECGNNEYEGPLQETRPACEHWQFMGSEEGVQQPGIERAPDGSNSICENCNHSEIVAQSNMEFFECPIREDYVLSYETCRDFIDIQIPESSLSGRDLTLEDTALHPTTDFNLYRLPHFDSELKYALARVFQYLQEPGSGDPSISIKLKFSEGSVKPTMEIDLPNKIKRSLDATTVIRENGTIRMELPAQTGLFDDEESGKAANAIEDTRARAAYDDLQAAHGNDLAETEPETTDVADKVDASEETQPEGGALAFNGEEPAIEETEPPAEEQREDGEIVNQPAKTRTSKKAVT